MIAATLAELGTLKLVMAPNVTSEIVIRTERCKGIEMNWKEVKDEES